LKQIKLFFGEVGYFTLNDKVAVYSVRSLNKILNKIIPHFDQYPLHTKKKADYLLFKSAALIIKTRSHLKFKGLQEIVNIKASINRGLSLSLQRQKAFPNTIPIQRPFVYLQEYTAD
jgi:LAGLIDADG endonuclease